LFIYSGRSSFPAYGFGFYILVFNFIHLTFGKNGEKRGKLKKRELYQNEFSKNLNYSKIVSCKTKNNATLKKYNFIKLKFLMFMHINKYVSLQKKL